MKRRAVSSNAALTEAQRKAIESVAESASVVAGAGSGKTKVLVERLRLAIGDDWHELDRVLAITFTEKAAAEMKSRLRRTIPPAHRHRLETAWIGTVHSCCAKILRQHAPLVGIDPSFAIVDENAAGMAIRQCVRTELIALISARNAHAAALVDALDFRNAVELLEELLSFRWHARQALSLPAGSDAAEERIRTDLAEVFSRVERAYGDELSRRGAVDFEGLEIGALSLLTDHAEVRKGYRRRFRHILVDEFQDTSDVQTALVLELFSPKQNRLFIVGDPRQSIYRFRGANVDCFAAALEAIERQHGTTIHLAHNFRSRRGIVDFVNRCQVELADGLFGQLLTDGISPATEGMLSARPDDDPAPAVVALRMDLGPETRVADRRAAEAGAIAAFIGDLLRRGEAKAGDIVCLFQALTGVAPYEAALRRARIPCRVSGGRGFLDRQEIADLVCALRFAADPDDDVALLGLLRSPLVGLSDDDLALMAGRGDARLAPAALSDPRCALLHQIRAMARHRSPSGILRAVLAETGYEEICDALDPSGGASANIERLIALAESIERQGPTPLLEFTGYLAELKKRSARLGDPPAAADATNAVRLMTVHAAKGLEFPVVILPDLFRTPPVSGGAWRFLRGSGIAFRIKDPLHPFGTRRESERYTALKDAEAEASRAESKRLLYVAMTRARDLLILPMHPGSKKDGPWHRWLSPVVERALEDGLAEEWKGGEEGPSSQSSESGETKTPLSHPSPLRGEGQTVFTVSELECYERCPQEYRLKYLLRLPACRLFPAGRDMGRGESHRLAANIRGSVVHGVLERIDPKKPEEIEHLIDLECIANGIIPDARARREIRVAIDAALALPIASALSSGSRELSFDWRVGEAIITGSIDWLCPAPEGFEVIDFKTDDVTCEEVSGRADGYDLQLVCYALAAEAATKKSVIATALAFLTPGVIHRVAMDARRRQEGGRRILQIMEAIDRGRFELPAAPPCITCPYHHNGICWEDRVKTKHETRSTKHDQKE